ncbi:MAG: ATP-binding protein, partial [Clostridiales bacterium]|nr:ATP-binding protein [Clostridiales bacterium]
ILSQLIGQYSQKRLANQQEEERRLKEVEEKLPKIGKMIEGRRMFLFDQLKKAAFQQAKVEENIEETIETYNRNIQKELQKGGYEKNYLQPIFDCSICKDTGYIADPIKKRCICLQKAYQEKISQSKGLYQNVMENFENYDSSVYSDDIVPGLGVSQKMYMESIKEKIYQYGVTFPENRIPDMLFVGKSGLGKTFLLQALAQKVRSRGFQVNYLTAYRFVELAREGHFTNQWEILEPVLTCDLLLIDDLGIEPMMENITIIQLFRTIDERQREGKATIISTNLNSVELQNRYTERIASRLLNPRQCELVAFVGNDVRRREK